MSYLTRLTLKANAGSLERILRVIRVRGFEVQGMTAHRDDDASCFTLTLALWGLRQAENLQRQLSKVEDVLEAEIVGPDPELSPVSTLRLEPESMTRYRRA